MFDSPAVLLYIEPSEDMFWTYLCFVTKEYHGKPTCVFIIFWDDIPMDWNAICITHNFSSQQTNFFLNGRLKESFPLKHNATFLNELAQPFSIGKDSPFYGQITDFNIWNRPLSLVEINEYALNCKEKFSNKTNPEFLIWSNASIKELGKNIHPFSMPRSFLTCFNSSGVKQSEKWQFLESIEDLTYSQSLRFCHFLKGYLLHLSSSTLRNLNFNSVKYWVPIKLNENSTNWEFDRLALNQSAEISLPFISGTCGMFD